MKKHIFSLTLIILALTVFTACEKEPKLPHYITEKPYYPTINEFQISYDSGKTYKFQDFNGTVEIPFTIEKSTIGTDIKVIAVEKSPVTASLEINSDGKSGIVTLHPDTQWDIDQTVTIRIGTNKISTPITVNVIRKELLFLDNRQKEITLELDDIARTWWVNLVYNIDPSYNYWKVPQGEFDVSIQQGKEWITLGDLRCDKLYPRVSIIGATQFLSFKHFIGSGTRKGTIIIKRKDCEGELKVNVIQSGSENPGSIRSALMALYNQCGGSEWKLQKNWGSDLDVEEWCGIHFMSLSVSEEHSQSHPSHNGYTCVGADGPPENTALEFDFWHEGYWNVIKGKIPDEFWNIKCGFKYFTVSFVENADINKVPASMWSPKLRGIELDNMQNGMPAYLCTDLSNISKAIDVEEITLHGKNFSGQLPNDIGKLKKLKVLEINGLDLKNMQPVDIGPCPASIVECKSLEHLYLDAISNTVPPEIVNLPNMKYCCYGTMTSVPIVLVDKR